MLRLMRIEPVPPATARVARATFPKGNRYLKLADEMEALCTDATFQALFPTHGQPALPPWRLALVTLLQFAEGLSDRQAADAVRSRIDWKYVLPIELTPAGFDFTKTDTAGEVMFATSSTLTHFKFQRPAKHASCVL